MVIENSLDYAQELDEQDLLSAFRTEYHIPAHNGAPAIYFCGNSLGLQPKQTATYIEVEMAKWRESGVEGHFNSPDPWVDYHKKSKLPLAELVGATVTEVVCMNNLTTNLHLLLASFYQPRGNRVKLMIEAGAFPSDHYAAESHMRRMGVDPDEHLILLKPEKGEIFQTEEILKAISEAGESLALVLLPGIQYYTGQFFDIRSITKKGHECGAFVGFDLAHAIGNVPLSLHHDEVDFATWCSYKYLNSGPGAISGIYVHERHCTDPEFPKLTGWWGHDRTSRFQMDNRFVPNPGVDAWMLSNMNILSAASHQASLDLFSKTSMSALRSKSLQLTGFLESLLSDDEILRENIRILSPKDPEQRGCQLSIAIDGNGKSVHSGLGEAGVVLDWREPDVIRVAPTPMYNTFVEVWHFCQILKKEIFKNAHK